MSFLSTFSGSIGGAQKGSISNIAAKQMGKKVGAIGDSYTAYGYDFTTAGKNNWRSSGYLSWVRVLSNQAIDISTSNVWANFSGEGTGEAIANGYHTSAAAAGLDFCFICLGSNDYSGGHNLSFSQITSNLTTIYNTVLASGAVIVAIAIPPRSSLGAADYKLYSRVNHWIRGQAVSNPRIIHVNCAPYVADPTTGDFVSNYSWDGNHLSAKGSYWLGKLVWDAISKFIPSRDLATKWYLDTYDATANPRGNQLTNPFLNGTAGAKGTTGGAGTVTGNVADSWTVDIGAAAAGLAVACSKVARTDGIQGYWQQLAISGTSPNTGGIAVVFTQSPSFSNLAVGDTVEALIEFELDAGHSNIMGVMVHNYWVGGTALDSYDMYVRTVTDPTWLDTGSTIKGVLRTAPITIPTGSTSARFRGEVLLLQNVAVAATVRFGRPTFIKTSAGF